MPITSARLKVSIVAGAVALASLGWGVSAVEASLASESSMTSSGTDSEESCFGVPATMVAPKEQRVVGTEGDDVIFAKGGAVAGRGGDDLICGRAFGVRGGSGDDRIQAFYQDAYYHGGPGDDVLYGVKNFAQQSNQVYLWGDAGNDRLVGQSASEFLHGGVGNDVLRGGPGTDLLKGKDGDDRLDGGKGEDRMNGGTGQDYCVDGARIHECKAGDAA